MSGHSPMSAATALRLFAASLKAMDPRDQAFILKAFALYGDLRADEALKGKASVR